MAAEVVGALDDGLYDGGTISVESATKATGYAQTFEPQQKLYEARANGAWLPPSTSIDMEEAEAIFSLIDQSHLSLGTGEIEDGRLNENDCRGLARAMRIDEDRFWRLLKKHGEAEGDVRVTFDEWLAAVEKSFLINKLYNKGPTNINSALREAYIELSKDNYRGKCIITWKGGAPGLNLNNWRPIIEGWICFDARKSSAELDYRKDGTAVVKVEGLNEHCPSNPRAKSCTWAELKATLMVGKVVSVDIVDCAY